MIEGKNLKLRTVKESDLDDLFAALDSIRLRGEYLESRLLSQKQFRDEFERTGFWQEQQGMILIEKETPIGVIWYRQSELLDGLTLQFLLFDPEARGRGFMTEALSLFCAYLFSTRKIQRLQIAAPDYLKAAFRVAQKCGFQFEGIAREAFFHRGRYLDLCLYALLRGDCKHLEIIYT
jgi:RimJ/RimL family protein N-acetyltransferase